jgi:hypothetical protein
MKAFKDQNKEIFSFLCPRKYNMALLKKRTLEKTSFSSQSSFSFSLLYNCIYLMGFITPLIMKFQLKRPLLEKVRGKSTDL